MPDKEWKYPNTIEECRAHHTKMKNAIKKAKDESKTMRDFINECADCKSSDELYDFFLNNFEKVVR